jgi:copper chaperone CopZ
MITVHVPAMTSRQDVRAISAVISDVPGVQSLRADLVTGTVQVTGSAESAAVTAAVTAAGYPAVDYTVAPATDEYPPTGSSAPRGRPPISGQPRRNAAGPVPDVRWHVGTPPASPTGHPVSKPGDITGPRTSDRDRP